MSTKSTLNAETCAYKTLRQSHSGEELKEESKVSAEVPKKSRKPVRNKTKIVEAVPGLDLDGAEIDEEMKQAMIIAAMADAADEELDDG